VWFDSVLALREFQVVEDRVEQGDRLHIQLSWEAQTDISTDYRLQFELLNASDGRLWTSASGLQPMRGGNPTHQWLEGDKVVDVHTLVIPDNVPAGYYLLRLIVIGKDGPVAISHSADAPVSHIAVGPIQIGKSLTDVQEPTYPVTATFAGNIRLIGYDLETAPNNSFLVTLYWQAASDIPRDYTVFVHFLSPEGELIAQHDSPPLLPTSFWVPGTQVPDAHTLVLPTELLSNAYQIRIGLYHWPDLERVPVVASGCLDAANDVLLVGRISLGDAQTPDKSTCPDVHWIEVRGK
jgi:hypothetical protein